MFGVTILGCNSAIPTNSRRPTAQAVTIDDHVLLLDCGEGTQMQMNAYKVKKSKVKHIFISHLHGDHYFGLIGLLNTFALLGRKEDLHLFAPQPIFELIDLQMKLAESTFPYTLHRHALPEENGLLLEQPGYTVSCFKVNHRIDCHGFVIKQKEKLRKLNVQAAQQYDIPSKFYYNIKRGEDYTDENGNVIQNELLTRTTAPSKSYAYCADTLFTDSFLEHIQHADLLYHEATYLKDMEEKAYSRFHSTAEQAAMIAKRAGVKRLIIGHYSSKYNYLQPFKTEAKAVFPNTELAREGITFLV